MAFSTSKARRQTLSTELRDWATAGSPSERRTAVLRLLPGTDIQRLASQLEELGASIISLGEAVTVISLTPHIVRKVSELPGVISVDTPTKLHPKF